MMKMRLNTMQETRRYILDILKTSIEATVDEVVDGLNRRRGGAITPVTVRHHLKILQDEGLVDAGKMRHRTSPGRPQHVYRLTEQGAAYFHTNYQRLAANLLSQIEKTLPSAGVNVILEGVAETMAREAAITGETMEDRLNAVIIYLTQHGYEGRWETSDQGYLLITHNCPYHHLAHTTDALCQMDMRLIAMMLGVVPRLISRIATGNDDCSYFIPAPEQQNVRE
jgi:predicted ArsR family transcriptional regulator